MGVVPKALVLWETWERFNHNVSCLSLSQTRNQISLLFTKISGYCSTFIRMESVVSFVYFVC